ncbi:cellulose biosynthesis protein BcsE [Halomonas sp. I1]|uniref:cellulose biosynthesis protein BcsE n=1 Tax=Halomonas sp. I1 TaxID=393536 RepID=UPI0028DDFD63|nr:cellulose biosynthesis protein BcsE [Halomonas sp. I1]MDT8896320.1 cellulose biosynthesis protein BcsE [Halomonas sp. I1]
MSFSSVPSSMRPERPHYVLGIEGLWPEFAALRCPGVYWLLSDRPGHADALILGMLASATPEMRVDWIAAVDHARQTAARLPPEQGPGRLSFFALPEIMNAEAWLRLPGELARGRRWRRQSSRMLILEIETPDLDGALSDDEELAQWCRQWRDWAVAHRVCVMIVSHGSRGLALRGRLHPFNDALDGLVHLQPVGEEGRFLVLHWRSDLLVCGGRDLTLAAKGLGWQLLSSMTQDEIVGSDDHEYLVQRCVLEGAPALSEHWHVYDSARAVVAQAVNAQAATVVLGLEHADEIEAVARWMHGLRAQRGNAIKLVVRELVPCLRYRDERLLSLCGVTLVIGASVPLSRFLSRLDGIQGQRFTRQISLDFEGVVASLHPVTPGGAVSSATFLDRIEQWLDSSAAEAVSSLMVALQPAGGLSPEQALHQCRLSRYGDMATLMEGRLYLFLFGCRSTDLEPALKRLFGLPDAALFESHDVFDAPETVALEVHRLIGRGWDGVSQTFATTAPMAVAEQEPTRDHEAASPRPLALRLRADAAQEGARS